MKQQISGENMGKIGRKTRILWKHIFFLAITKIMTLFLSELRFKKSVKLSLNFCVIIT